MFCCYTRMLEENEMSEICCIFIIVLIVLLSATVLVGHFYIVLFSVL